MIISLSASCQLNCFQMQTCEARSEERWCAVRLGDTRIDRCQMLGRCEGQKLRNGTNWHGIPSGREPASGRKNKRWIGVSRRLVEQFT